MAETTETLSTNDISLLNRFKAKASEFMIALDRLNSIDNVPGNLQEEYSGLRSTADYVQGTINWITSTVDSVTGFFSDYFGFDGVSGVRDYINGDNRYNDQSMGVIPLIPLAAISGAVALMSKFIVDVYVFERKVSEQKRLENTGMSPQQAAEVVDKIKGKTLTDNLAGIVKPVAWGLGLFFISRIIMGYKKR